MSDYAFLKPFTFKNRECKIFCVNGYLEGIEKGKAFPV